MKREKGRRKQGGRQSSMDGRGRGLSDSEVFELYVGDDGGKVGVIEREESCEVVDVSFDVSRIS